MSTADKHSLRSSEREEYLEYIFLGALCSYGWSQDRFVEVARSHTDAFGYDLVLSAEQTTRHLQLKSSVVGGRTRTQSIRLDLGQKPSGCVVWMKIDADDLQPVSYGWFGDDQGGPLPDLGDKVARHTKGDATGHKSNRAGLRQVPWSSFKEIDTMPGLFERLFP